MTERSRWYLAVTVLGLVLGGCQRVGGALAVKLHADPALVADCLQVTVLDGATPVRWVVVPRAADSLVAVVRTFEMPAAVTLQASALLGDCADQASLRLNGRGPAVAATFPETAVVEVPLAVGPPGGDLDADGDGYVAAALGGADCDDTSRAIHPGATQDCGSLVDANCDGKVACADPTCTAAAACADPPDRLLLSGLSTVGTVGACLGPVTVELRNVSGPRAATQATGVALTVSGLGAYLAAGCAGAAASQVTIPLLGTSAQLWVRLDRVGPASLSASAAPLTPAVAELVVQPTAITALTLSGVPASLRAGECSGPVTVALQGAGGPTTVPAGSTFTITLGAQPQDAAGNFFTTPDCSLPATSALSIGGGQGTATFRLKATRVPSVALTASGVGGLSAQATVAVSAGPASQVAFLNTPLGLRSSDACSTVRNALLQLETRDPFGNPAPAGSTVRLGLSSGGPPLSFYLADAGVPPCATQLTEVAIPQGASRADVALRVTGTGTGTVTAAPNLAGFLPASQAYTAAAGDPVRVVFTSSPQVVQAGQCTPVDLVLEARDSASTASSFTAPLQVQLVRSGGAADASFAFYAQAGCAAGSAITGGLLTFPAGQSQVHFFFRGEKTAAFSVVATPTSGGILGATSAGNEVRAGPPAALVWTPTTASAVAGTCAAPLTLQVQDGYANLTAFPGAMALSLVSAPAGATFGLAAGQCLGTPPFTLDAGVQSLPVAARATATGSYLLSASASGSGVSTATPATLTVAPGAGTLAVSPSGTVAVTAGACQQLSYALADALGNPVPAGAGGDTLALGALPGGVSAYPTLLDCTSLTGAATTFPVAPGAAGRALWVRATAASGAAVTVAATLAGSTAPVGLLVSADLAAALAFQGLPASQPSGACSGALAVRRLDRFGNPATSGAASAGVSGGALTYTASADCSGAGGPSAGVTFGAGASVSSAFSVSGSAAGATTVTADAGAFSVASTFTVSPGPPAVLRFTSAAGSVLAGACAGPLTLQVRDGAGNPTPATNLAVTLASSPDPVAFFGDGACGAALDGGFALTGTGATLSFRARAAPAAETLTAAAASLGSSDFQLWTVGRGPPAAVAWTTPPPATLARSTCSNAASVRLEDLGGNPVPPAGATSLTFTSASPDAGLAFYLDALCASPAGAVAVDGAGAASVYLGAVGSGATTVTAGGGALAPAPGQVVAVVGDPGVLAVAAPQADLEAGGCMALTITRDAGVQPSLGVTALRFSVSDAGLSVHGDATCAAPALAGAAIPEGAVSTTVWLRGRSVPAPLSTLELTVSDATQGCLPAVQTVRTYPLVRRGSCDIPGGAFVSSCNLGLPFDDVSRTFLVFQATSGSSLGTNALVECHLVVPDAGVRCSRQGNSGAVTASVQWQAVSWGRGADDGGLTVQHLTGALETAAAATQSVARGPADLRRAFLLFGASSDGQSNASHVEDLGIARLTDDGGVLVARTSEAGALPSGDYSLQVVELGGARVDRGTLAGGTVLALGATSALASPATSRLSALFSARVAAPGTTNDVCPYSFRGAVTGAALALHRGLANPSGTCQGLAVPELAYEFIEWPAGTVVDRPGSATDAGFVDLATNALTGSWVPAQGVSAHRTLLYHPGQGGGGQCWGETDRGSPELGSAAGLLTVSGGTVTITRGFAGTFPNNARFTPVAVTFDP